MFCFSYSVVAFEIQVRHLHVCFALMASQARWFVWPGLLMCFPGGRILCQSSHFQFIVGLLSPGFVTRSIAARTSTRQGGLASAIAPATTHLDCYVRGACSTRALASSITHSHRSVFQEPVGWSQEGGFAATPDDVCLGTCSSAIGGSSQRVFFGVSTAG